MQPASGLFVALSVDAVTEGNVDAVVRALQPHPQSTRDYCVGSTFEAVVAPPLLEHIRLPHSKSRLSISEHRIVVSPHRTLRLIREANTALVRLGRDPMLRVVVRSSHRLDPRRKHVWPPGAGLAVGVNGTWLTPTGPGELDITDALSATSTIKFSATACACAYQFTVLFKRSSTVESIVSEIVNVAPRIPPAESLGIILDMFHVAAQAGIEQSPVPVPLLCPLSMARIKIPVRGTACNHARCFDLTAFLNLNKMTNKWACPVCEGSLKIDSLRIDMFTWCLLQRTNTPGLADTLLPPPPPRPPRASDSDSDSDWDDDDDDEPRTIDKVYVDINGKAFATEDASVAIDVINNTDMITNAAPEALLPENRKRRLAREPRPRIKRSKTGPDIIILD